MVRFGGLRARWLAPEPDPDAADLQRRLARRGLTATLHAQGLLVTAEIPSVREVDTPRVLQLLQGPAVEIHELEPGGALDRRVVFDQSQIKEAVVTSIITGAPTVAFMLWRLDRKYKDLWGVRVAITVDHDVRWTARIYRLLGDVGFLDADRGDLAEALGGDALHGGTIVDAVYVPPTDLAPFAWAARGALAVIGGVAAALIASLLLRALARYPRRNTNAVAGMHWGCVPQRAPVQILASACRSQGASLVARVRRPHMRFMVMHKVDALMEAGGPPPGRIVQEMGEFVQRGIKSGVFKDGAGLHPSSRRVRLVFEAGRRTIAAGPLQGRNELLASFAMVKADSMDHAIEIATRIAGVLGDGEIEIGPVVEPWDIGVMERPARAPLRFLLLRKADRAFEAGAAEPAALTRLLDELGRDGVLQTSATLAPSATGARYRKTGGKRAWTDGPFTESKELVAGFSIVELPSLQDAKAWAEAYAAILGDNEVDVRVVAGTV